MPLLLFLLVITLVAVTVGALVTQQVYAWKNRRRWVGAEVGIVLGIVCWLAGFFILFRGDLVMSFIGVGILIFPAQLPVLFFLSKFRRCPECGQAVRNSHQFCQNCGYDLAGVKVHRAPVAAAWDNLTRLGCLPTVVALVFLIGWGVVFLAGNLFAAPQYPSNAFAPPTPGPTPTPIPMIEVVTALQNLPRGYRFPDTVEELQTVVGTYPWPEYSAPFNAVYSRQDLLGKVVLTDLYREQPILVKMIGDGMFEPEQITGYAAATLPNGQLTYGITAQGVITGAQPNQEWVFVGTAGETATFGVVLEKAGYSFSPTLTVWAEESEKWIEGKRTTRGYTTTLTVSLPDDGLYRVVVGIGDYVGGSPSSFYRLGVVRGASEPLISGEWLPLAPTPTPVF